MSDEWEESEAVVTGLPGGNISNGYSEPRKSFSSGFGGSNSTSFGGRGRGRFTGGGKGDVVTCYKCNEEGHMSRECTNAPKVGGSGCRKCGEDGHFARECTKENGTENSSRSRSCYNCNEDGHMSRDCPNPRKGGTGGGSGCRKCGEDGHFARECPKENGDGAESSDRPKGCYNCKEEGHMSKDCPKGGGSGCRKCGEDGHFARDCTKPPEECLNSGDADAEGRPPPVTYVPVELDELHLFEQGVEAGINFAALSSVSVKVSGGGDIPPQISSFSDAGLRPLLLENIGKAQYTKPTPIQRHTIPIIMSGRDLMGSAQTGSGKTAAFLLPMLNYILVNNVSSCAYEEATRPTALILAPTRELAIQIYNEARKFSLGSIIKVRIVYGGTSVSHQHKGLQEGCHVLVATPGRLLDYVDKSRISFSAIKFLVLDEADRMLDMGFKPAIDRILRHDSTPGKDERQTLMFSATFAEEIQQLAKTLMNDYVFVVTGIVGGANIDVHQTFLNIEKADKRETLLSFINDSLESNPKEKILVFVETKRMADFIALFLCNSKVSSTSIHGDRHQHQREEALSQFKSGERNILVATAVAARGLDIKGVGIVVNFDMPKELDEYVHRIGRTGRVGNPGRAISYFDQINDAHLAKGLVKLVGDAEQEVPEWLVECASSSGLAPQSYGGFDNFGARDIRSKGVRTEEFPAAHAMGGPYENKSRYPRDEEPRSSLAAGIEEEVWG